MITIAIRHKVEDFEQWKRSFDAGRAIRRAAGETGCRIYSVHGSPDDVLVSLDWTSLDQARAFLSTPHLTEGMLSVIDMTDWSLIKTIPTDGPGFFLRSHANSPYVWADVFTGENKGHIHIIDKQTLTIVRTLIPEPGKTVAHTEFTRDGKYALVSIWEMDGAVIVMTPRRFRK